jgi:hypothetical protein
MDAIFIVSSQLVDNQKGGAHENATNKKAPLAGGFFIGAQDWTRTSTILRTLAPEASASTNSATWALQEQAL